MPDIEPSTSQPDQMLRALMMIAVLVLLGIAALLAVQTFDHPPDIWSYAIIAPKDQDFEKELNRAGALGWEVVSARRATDGQGYAATTAYELILKRRGAAPFSPQQSGKP